MRLCAVCHTLFACAPKAQMATSPNFGDGSRCRRAVLCPFELAGQDTPCTYSYVVVLLSCGLLQIVLQTKLRIENRRCS